MYTKDQQLYVAHSANGPICLVGKMCNRHGLIAGATGTGKTVSLQVLAETFSQAGVPCFMADMKGDLSGISQTGAMSSFIQKRCAEFGIENPQFQPCPVRFWDVFGEQGYPMRTTVSAMGPQLLARLLGLNETQAGVLNIVFRVADDRGLLILDIKDLRSMLDYVLKNAKDFISLSSSAVGADLAFSSWYLRYLPISTSVVCLLWRYTVSALSMLAIVLNAALFFTFSNFTLNWFLSHSKVSSVAR